MAHLCATVNKVHKYNAKGETSSSSTDESTPTKMKIISSSGGNAGLAVTTVARSMPEMDVSVVVPETTKPLVVNKLQSLGAKVTIHGSNWNTADTLARKWVEEAKENGGHAVYVSPYDNPLLWTGHSTVVDEIITQILSSQSQTNHHPKIKIGAILASVGGGGLLCGILEGIERNYYCDNEMRMSTILGSKIFACETEGASSFAASFRASKGKKDPTMVRLDGITSVATSLGALEVTPAVIQRAHRHQERGESTGNGEDVLSYVCTDSEAIDACLKFASDHRMLVEPACGASLAPLYSDRLRQKLLDELQGDTTSAIVVEVCGGSGVNLDLLEAWKEQFIDN